MTDVVRGMSKDEKDQAEVIRLAGAIMGLLAGCENAIAQTTLTLSVAASIITTMEAHERLAAVYGFCQSVEQWVSDPEKVAWLESCKVVTVPTSGNH
jgi:hypothetical protein